MPRDFRILLTATGSVVIAIAIGALAQQPTQVSDGAQKKAKKAPSVRPPLFFREEWKQPPYTGQLNDVARRLTQDAVTNPNLQLKVYGPCKDTGVEVYGTPNDTAFPMNLWTGMCPSPVSVTLRERSNFVDLTGLARIKWTFRASNLHAVRPVLKFADGTLIVANHADVTPNGAGDTEPAMVESEFALDGVRWFMLNPETVATTRPMANPDLSRVDAANDISS